MAAPSLGQLPGVILLVGDARAIVANLHRHNEAIRCYQGREWELEEHLFGLLTQENPDDPLYDYYLNRIGEFKRRPPPPEWRGEIRFTVS